MNEKKDWVLGMGRMKTRVILFCDNNFINILISEELCCKLVFVIVLL